MEFLIGAAVLVVAAIGISAYARKKRREQLMLKYGNEQIVALIMAKKIWQGMTAEQLVDSWGKPSDVDTKVYKRKTTDTYKYTQTGKNRFRSRVKVENGIIVGWDQK